MIRTRFRTLFFSVIAGSAMLAACGPSVGNTSTFLKDTVAVTTDTAASVDGTIPDAEYETLYIVIADTAQRYYSLQSAMYALSAATHIPVDTQGRHYNEQKDLIALPDDDEDEIWAGDYYPRRDAGTSLSLEYYNRYDSISTQKNIALVAAQYETRKSADSLLAIIHPHAPHTFIKAASIFIGCMH